VSCFTAPVIIRKRLMTKILGKSQVFFGFPDSKDLPVGRSRRPTPPASETLAGTTGVGSPSVLWVPEGASTCMCCWCPRCGFCRTMPESSVASHQLNRFAPDFSLYTAAVRRVHAHCCAGLLNFRPPVDAPAC
jgi:hypothetical protein